MNLYLDSKVFFFYGHSVHEVRNGYGNEHALFFKEGVRN